MTCELFRKKNTCKIHIQLLLKKKKYKSMTDELFLVKKMVYFSIFGLACMNDQRSCSRRTKTVSLIVSAKENNLLSFNNVDLGKFITFLGIISFCPRKAICELLSSTDL